MSARTRLGEILRRAGSASGRRAAGGFTLLEILIAVGALGLIAVGISQVFRATGDTVRAGRRISNLNSYAALIERQLRDDFSKITRDGFLLIRNERVWRSGNPGGTLIQPMVATGVPLVPDHAASARPRRCDEVVFFVTGDFVTKRPPAIPDRVARAPAARIYLGHGLRRDPKRPAYPARIVLSDDNTTPHVSIDPPAALGQDNNSGVYPNEAASSWTLLRFVTLLAPPTAAKVDGFTKAVQGNVNQQLASPRLNDGMWQIAGQPAVRSIFRSFNGSGAARNAYSEFPPTINQVIHRGMANLDPDDGPSFGTGAIDIATCDLTEIRALIHAATTLTVQGSQWHGGPPGELSAFDAIDIQNQANGRWPTSVPTMPVIPPGFADDSPVAIMQAWMRDALPVDSDAPTRGPDEGIGGRMRCEPAPPNPLCINITGMGAQFSAATVPLMAQREAERADQLMLSAHNFVPGCTEFIVEWSWGDTYTTNDARFGQIIWHGLERQVDLDGDGSLSPAAGERAAFAYECDQNGNGGASATPHRQWFVRKDGSLGWRWVQGRLINTNADGDDEPDPPGINANIQYNYFGFINPTYEPAGNPQPDQSPPMPNPGLLVDFGQNGGPANGVYEPNLGDKLNDPETIPWPWPRLVRITMSLVDPSDPTIEQTYQFIFDLPGDPVDPHF